jgi:diguanylate cyclase (GGDEF)-like protein
MGIWVQAMHFKCLYLLDNFKIQHPFEMGYRLKRHDGQYRWINDRGVPFYNDYGIFIGFIGSCMDVTEKIEGQRLIEMAQNDTLCKTYNRQYSHQLLEDVFRQAKEEGLPLSILMMDIDDFKNINDLYGHAVGDVVLADVAAIVKTKIRNFDILGRYGGDEFLIGLAHTDLASAFTIAGRISSAVSSAPIPIPGGTPIRVTTSLGVKSLVSELSLDVLIDGADKKMYEAKREGKNLVKS